VGKPVTLVALGAISSLSDEERYRKQAEDRRQMAAKAISPLDKEAWLKLAGDWLRLAETGLRGKNPAEHWSRLVWLKVCVLLTGQFS
jgi:hypothetical protein